MKKILVVDDEANIRRLYRDELSDEGYTVFAAGDSDEAIRLFEAELPDVVVLDVRMPGRDGLAVLGEMLSLRRDTHVVLNSAYPAFRADFQSWGADAYVVKSSDLSELKRTIQIVLTGGSTSPASGAHL
jgi:DNA-binding response OmpR family regulator